uniref:Fatty acyl-CoA reductase n=1 Tax=Agrotis segetum TaxID=47767 RepID=A0A068FL32_AGRSE|nr:fatty acyl reductase [Agrotis segetum]AID66648.1 fatty acyl reductase [Agrotis segetum]
MPVLTSREDEKLSVPEFYAGKSIFVTGGTGFLGKVFIEKLLYCCPDIDKIYMLIREKKNLSIDERMSKFLDDPLFSRLKEERPGDLEKIVLIPGDITAPNLGLSAENERILLEKVSVIINSAATVKFNEPLPIAWKINVEGTRMLLALSRRMKRIEVFIHISTAYSNASSDRIVVDEILYPAPADMDQVYQLVKDGVTEEETERLLNGLPNTYTFTKALTEHLVAEHQTYVPTIIIRPSVVASIKDEPIRGWLCNWFGATGISVFTAKGLNRVLLGKASNIVDVIPVDYVANLVIVAGAKSGGQKSDELKIYNCCSSDCNPVTLKKIIKEFTEDTIKNKSHIMPLPGWFVFTKYKWLLTLLTIIFQMLPMYLADVYRVLTGKIPRYMKLHHLVIQTRLGIDFFTSHSWVMKTDRVRELFGSLSLAEKHMFPCDPSSIDWTDYLQSYCYGVRRFLEKKK